MDKELDFLQSLLRKYKDLESLIDRLEKEKREVRIKILEQGRCPNCGKETTKAEVVYAMVIQSKCKNNDCNFMWAWLKE